MTITTRKVASAMMLLFASSAANSALITWQVDITLPVDPLGGDPTPDPSVGQITGTFVFDTVTLLLSNVDVSATGTAFAASSSTLTSVFGPYSDGGRYFELLPIPPSSDLTNIEDISIKLDPPGLTSAGGIIDVTSVTTYLCLDANCDTFTETYSSNQVTGTLTAVPLPVAAWLFGSGLLGLTGIARRKQHTQL